MAAIEIKELSHVYSPKTPFSKTALDSVSFSVPEGSFFGIIGHTGSGKSTLIQHFNALIEPQKGSVKVLGTELNDKKANRRAIRERVGMVFQYPEYQLFAETVFEDVAFGYRNFHEGKNTDPGRTEMAVRTAIEMVGLDYESVKDKSPLDLSGGQKRRVAIAGVIVTQPSVLVLDEPTAGLDPEGKREIFALIHQLKRNVCKTVIIIGHNMDEIAQNCDCILVLSKGRAVYNLPPSELFVHEDELLSLGLDLPTPARLARALREKGLDIPKGLYTNELFCQAIEKLIGEGNKHA